MKLLVLSDSHGARANLKRFELLARELKPDYVIHLGDHADDLDMLDVPGRKLAVRGNCDLFSYEPPLRAETFGGVDVMLCHGHHYGVKSGLDNLEAAANSRGAKLALFGHTHQSIAKQCANTLLINPGAVVNGYPSCALIELEKGEIRSYDILTF